MGPAAFDLCRTARARGLVARWDQAPGLGAVLAAGPDAGAFLQSQLTSDVQALAPGQGQWSARLTRQGALVAWFALHRLPAQGQPHANYLLLTAASQTADLVADLERTRVDEGVVLEDVSAEFEGWALQGPATPAVAEALGASLDRRGLLELDRPLLGDPGRLYLWPQGRAAAGAGAALSAAAAAAGCAVLDDGPEAALAWDWLRTEAGWPLAGRDFEPGSGVLPQTGLEQQVLSRTKGCYLGQEVVARIRTYGSVPRVLRGLVLDLAPAWPLPLPAPGSPLLDAAGRRLGTWAGGALSVVHGAPVALAALDRQERTPGRRLVVQLTRGTAAAEVFLLPLYRAEDDAGRAAQLHRQAVRSFGRGADGEAVALLEEALRLDPRRAESFEILAVILDRGARTHEAIDLLHRLAEIAPDEPMVHVNLSRCYAKLGDVAEAERQKALATVKRFADADGDPAAARRRAAAEREALLGEARRREAMFAQVLALDPGDALARMGLGTALADQDRHAEAAGQLAEALRLQPDSSPLHLALALSLEALERRQEARAAYRRGIAVASRRGDLLPLHRMEHRLLLLGDDAAATRAPDPE